jgi:ABC-type phosphate transport system auxiliary subunit
MSPKEIAHNAHLQSLRLLNNRELHIDELIKEKNYAEIVNEKRNYQKIVKSLEDLIHPLKEKYTGYDMQARTSKEGQILRRWFLNTANLEKTLMP